MDDEPRDAVAFQLADTAKGDRGAIHLSRNRPTGDVESGGYEIQWLDNDGYPAKVELNKLKHAAAPASVGAAFDTETFERGEASLRTAAADDETDGIHIFEEDGPVGDAEMADVSAAHLHSNIPSLPSASDIRDAFGSALSSFADAVDAAEDEISNAVSVAIENARDTTIDDIAIDSAYILVETKFALFELVDEFEKRGLTKAIWYIRVGFVDTLWELGTSGALRELADGNYGCGGCIAVITITVGVGLAVTASATCTALGIGTLGWGGVACVTFFGVVLSYGETIIFSEAEDICSGHHRPRTVDVC